MPKFSGFPAGKVQFISLPGPFFSDLLPDIDNLEELKVTLYAFWYLNHQEGEFRYMRLGDITRDRRFMNSLGQSKQDALAALKDAIQRAVERGTLLTTQVEFEKGIEPIYCLNTPRGRAAIQAIERGEWRNPVNRPAPVELGMERPNIYRLYEQNIGPLTPLLADALKEAEESYPADWIEDAVRIAVENNVRRWRYVEAILRSWQEEGRDEQNRRDTQKDRRRYIEGKFADFIEH